jgi:hypothetical protein
MKMLKQHLFSLSVADMATCLVSIWPGASSHYFLVVTLPSVMTSIIDGFPHLVSVLKLPSLLFTV